MTGRARIALMGIALVAAAATLASLAARSATAASLHTLSGNPEGTTAFLIDHDLDLLLNGVPIRTENNPEQTPRSRAPIQVLADPDDVLGVRVRDTFGDCAYLTTLYLTDAGGRSAVADPGFDLGCGRPNADLGVVHEHSFVIPNLSEVPAAELAGEVRPGPDGSFPSSFQEFAGALYFAADDGVSGEELWRLDASGTLSQVGDVNDGPGSSNPRQLTVAGGLLYFVAETAAEGRELWSYDGTGPPALAADINQGPASSDIEELTSYGTQVVFRANDGVVGEELFVFDAAGLRFFDLWPEEPSCAGTCWSLPYGLTVYDGILYFGAGEPTFGGELYSYDGTSVQRLTDIVPGSGSAVPDELTGVGDHLVFSAYNASGWNELYSYEISSGTWTEIATGNQPFGAYPSRFTTFGGRAYFGADDPVTGRELWSTDGTQAGTALIEDVNPGAASSNLTDYANFNGELYFAVSNVATGPQIRATNGFGTRLVLDANPFSDWDDPTPFGSYIVFSMEGPGAGQQVWFTTGTAPGTAVMRTVDGDPINPSGQPVDDPSFTFFNGALYFRANDGSRGDELWRVSLIALTSTSTSLRSSLNPSPLGQTVRFTATVSGGSPTGTVTFRDGTAVLGTAPLVGGSASLDVAGLADGSHPITATYDGDAYHARSTSSVLSQLVLLPSPPTLTVSKVGRGTVSSSPAGIDCGGDCSQVYLPGQVVTLSAPSNANAIFLGWDGDPDCTDGTVTMTGDRSCVAVFVKRTGPTLRPNLKFDKRPTVTFLDPASIIVPVFPFDVWWVVENTGFYFRGPFVVRWYFSTDRKLSPNDVLLEEQPAEIFASPGHMFGWDYRAPHHRIRDSLIPADTPAGFYYYIGIIDPDDVIDEQNENDNQIELRIEIRRL